jgi:hypothetical protein
MVIALNMVLVPTMTKLVGVRRINSFVAPKRE